MSDQTAIIEQQARVIAEQAKLIDLLVKKAGYEWVASTPKPQPKTAAEAFDDNYQEHLRIV